MNRRGPRVAWALALCCAIAHLGAAEEAELKAAGGEGIRYAIELPKVLPPAATTDPAKQLGLFLCFHEHGGKAGDEIPTVAQSLARLKLSAGYILIGVFQAAHGYTRQDHAHTVELVAWAKRTYAVNPRRIYAFGRGEGATMAAEFALEHPELVAAAITYSWGFRLMPAAADPLRDLPSLYVVLGQKDIPTHLAMVRDTYARAKPHGYQLVYREFPNGGGSVDPATNDDAILWATLSRNKVLPLAEREAALLKPLAIADAAHPVPASAGLFNNVMLVGGPQAGALLVPLLAGKDDAARLMAVHAAEHAVLGEDALIAIAGLLGERSPALRKAALAALGANVAWGSPVAKRALAAFVANPATGKPADPAERALAIAAIGQGLALQLKGHQQDVALFAALVDLLDDPDLHVRTSAFTVLQPLLASDYHPEAGKDARAATLAAWRKWLADITAKEPAGPATDVK